jgi:starch synthase
MVSSEAAPLAKTGGLADVVGALPSALRDYGDEAAVLIPRYPSIDLKNARRVYDHLPVHFGPDRYDVAIWQAPQEYPLYLADCPCLYQGDGLYGDAQGDYPNNHLRFAVLARAALGVARWIFKTDVFHCHDWQAGLVPVYLRTTFAADPTFLGVKTLFTIHNLGYQGLFPRAILREIGLDDSVFHPDCLEFFGQASYIKGGIVYSDWLSTVSPTYAQEIQTPEYGFGLDGALRARAGVLTGILNGADYREWSPENDPLIPAHYSAADPSGKAICKRELLAELGLPPEAAGRPLLVAIFRLTPQKGPDLLLETIEKIVAQDAYVAVLGMGDPDYEAAFRAKGVAAPTRIAVHIGFDNALAHRMIAGADLLLMPSRYEPCGLSQIYGLRYGAIPIVRATGGLNDTIEEGTGFKFTEYSGESLLRAVQRAIGVYSDQNAWREMMQRGMRQDFSWKASAGAYSALYRRLLARS